MKSRVTLILLLIIVIVGVVTGNIIEKNKPCEKIGYALDTQIRIVVYDKGDFSKTVEDAYSEILRLDSLLSNFNEKSQTYILNEKKELEVSDELLSIIKSGIDITDKTNGSFDITIFPLSEIWDYKKATVPEILQIKEAKSKVSASNIEITENKVALKNDAKIDVSSTAKGYIADYVISFLKAHGVKNALVDAGGNIKVIGSPDKKGKGFKIGIKDPDKDESISLGVITLKDKSIVTSGVYERNFDFDGTTYHHIIDPFTGYPADSDVLGVSVISDSSINADGIATSIVVMGAEKGLALVEETKDLECIIIKKDNTIVTSSGVKNFKITSSIYKIGG